MFEILHIILEKLFFPIIIDQEIFQHMGTSAVLYHIFTDASMVDLFGKYLGDLFNFFEEYCGLKLTAFEYIVYIITLLKILNQLVVILKRRPYTLPYFLRPTGCYLRVQTCNKQTSSK